jgi:hypothetical protein
MVADQVGRSMEAETRRQKAGVSEEGGPAVCQLVWSRRDVRGAQWRGLECISQCSTLCWGTGAGFQCWTVGFFVPSLVAPASAALVGSELQRQLAMHVSTFGCRRCSVHKLRLPAAATVVAWPVKLQPHLLLLVASCVGVIQGVSRLSTPGWCQQRHSASACRVFSRWLHWNVDDAQL